MKNFVKSAFLMAAAIALTMFSGIGTLRVSAESSTSYFVKYDAEESQWRVQIGSWNDEDRGKDVYYLNNGDSKIKDGDILVVEKNGQEQLPPAIEVNAHLSNLTIVRAKAVVKANGIDDCYVLGDSYAAINGDVTNAYLYDNLNCTFNNNVTNLTITNSDNSTLTCVSVAGTVDHLLRQDKDKTLYEYYDFAAGKLTIDDKGLLQTSENYYSKTPSARPQAAVAGQAAAKPGSVPAEDVYIVQRGDTFSKIARKYGMTTKQLAALNPQIKNINLIWAKQEIRLK